METKQLKSGGFLFRLMFMTLAVTTIVSCQGQRDSNQNNNTMIAVIFEVTPHEGRMQEYLDIALDLKKQLDSIPGFISIERFQSISHPGKILSLSFWESEAAVERWRNMQPHRLAQEKGRKFLFRDYRLRIASVIRDYGIVDRAQAPADSREYHQ